MPPHLSQWLQHKKIDLQESSQNQLVNLMIKSGKSLNKVCESLAEFGLDHDNLSASFIASLGRYLIEKKLINLERNPKLRVDYHLMRNLIQVKSTIKLGQNSSILYVGSGNDITVQKVFPQVINVDLYDPNPLPKNFNFVNADAFNLPFSDDSIDLLVLHCLPIGVYAAASEFRRVLREDGHLLCSNSEITPHLEAFSKNGNTTDDVHSRLSGSKVLTHFYKNNFEISPQTPTQRATLFRGGRVDDQQVENLNQSAQANRFLIYDALEKLDQLPRLITTPFGTFFFVDEDSASFSVDDLNLLLGLDFQAEVGQRKHRLNELQSEMSTKVYEKMKYLIENVIPKL